MKFEMWTWYHYLYIVSPIIVAVFLFVLVRKRSERVKYLVAIGLAVINMAILIARNVDIFVRLGRIDGEIIPLGPCHFANIIFLIAVVFKKQNWYDMAWSLSLPFGFLAH